MRWRETAACLVLCVAIAAGSVVPAQENVDDVDESHREARNFAAFDIPDYEDVGEEKFAVGKVILLSKIAKAVKKGIIAAPVMMPLEAVATDLLMAGLGNRVLDTLKDPVDAMLDKNPISKIPIIGPVKDALNLNPFRKINPLNKLTNSNPISKMPIIGPIKDALGLNPMSKPSLGDKITGNAISNIPILGTIADGLELNPLSNQSPLDKLMSNPISKIPVIGPIKDALNMNPFTKKNPLEKLLGGGKKKPGDKIKQIMEAFDPANAALMGATIGAIDGLIMEQVMDVVSNVVMSTVSNVIRSTVNQAIRDTIGAVLGSSADPSQLVGVGPSIQTGGSPVPVRGNNVNTAGFGQLTHRIPDLEEKVLERIDTDEIEKAITAALRDLFTPSEDSDSENLISQNNRPSVNQQAQHIRGASFQGHNTGFGSQSGALFEGPTRGQRPNFEETIGQRFDFAGVNQQTANNERLNERLNSKDILQAYGLANPAIRRPATSFEEPQRHHFGNVIRTAGRERSGIQREPAQSRATLYSAPPAAAVSSIQGDVAGSIYYAESLDDNGQPQTIVAGGVQGAGPGVKLLAINDPARLGSTALDDTSGVNILGGFETDPFGKTQVVMVSRDLPLSGADSILGRTLVITSADTTKILGAGHIQPF